MYIYQIVINEVIGELGHYSESDITIIEVGIYCIIGHEVTVNDITKLIRLHDNVQFLIPLTVSKVVCIQ